MSINVFPYLSLQNDSIRKANVGFLTSYNSLTQLAKGFTF